MNEFFFLFSHHLATTTAISKKHENNDAFICLDRSFTISLITKSMKFDVTHYLLQ